MPRFLIGWLLGLGGAAVGLLLCDLLFEGFKISSFTGFLWAILIFAILSGLFSWLTFRALIRHAGSIVALTGLISTFIALLVTVWLTDDLTIEGASTWFWSVLIIWLLDMFIWLIPGPWRNYRKDGERR